MKIETHRPPCRAQTFLQFLHGRRIGRVAGSKGSFELLPRIGEAIRLRARGSEHIGGVGKAVLRCEQPLDCRGCGAADAQPREKALQIVEGCSRAKLEFGNAHRQVCGLGSQLRDFSQRWQSCLQGGDGRAAEPLRNGDVARLSQPFAEPAACNGPSAQHFCRRLQMIVMCSRVSYRSGECR